MKLSLDWLGDYITWTEKDLQKIADRITECVAEVDEVEEQGALLDGCCVGKVLKIDKHPDADKLQLCNVKTDKGTKRVFCGGTNVYEGMKVAFAHIGARVRWHGTEMMTLEKTKIRGQESEGMICGAEELDITTQFPASVGPIIVDMGEGDEGVGKDLRSYLGLTDTVLHIDNHAITHRADLFSHVGFARECVAIGLAKWKRDPTFQSPTFAKDAIPFKMAVKDKTLMPRYCSCVIDIEGLGTTPDWMVKRLEATGWRSLSTAVDITNYVMMEVGVPLHSFDAADIKGAIVMRAAKKGEKITTLDGKERDLSEGALILEDDDGIFDLLGIMGGMRASTQESTRQIYLHSCSLEPISIRKAMIEMGHRTDAGTVYEKGIPPIVTEQGFYRAAQLMLELLPGARIASAMDSFGDNGAPTPIAFSPERCNSMLGSDISEKDMHKIFTDLGFDVSKKGITPPVWRLQDIEGEHDLIEEVGRVYGFDALPVTLPDAPIDPPVRETRVNTMRDALKEEGFFEILPLNLVSPTLLKKCNLDPTQAVSLENPLGEELSLLQTSTLPGLLDHAETNLLHAGEALNTFYAAKVFGNNTEEHWELGGLVANRIHGDIKHEPFLVLKSALHHALESAGYSPEWKKAKTVAAYAHPGRSADITVDGEVIGHLCELLPEVRERFDLPERAAACSVNLAQLLGNTVDVTVAQPLPHFPAVTYDLTVEMDHDKSVGDVLEKIRSSSALLESVEITDLYKGKSSEGGYQLTIRCTYRAADRTLEEEEVKKEHEKVTKVLVPC